MSAPLPTGGSCPDLHPQKRDKTDPEGLISATIESPAEAECRDVSKAESECRGVSMAECRGVCTPHLQIGSLPSHPQNGSTFLVSLDLSQPPIPCATAGHRTAKAGAGSWCTALPTLPSPPSQPDTLAVSSLDLDDQHRLQQLTGPPLDRVPNDDSSISPPPHQSPTKDSLAQRLLDAFIASTMGKKPKGQKQQVRQTSHQIQGEGLSPELDGAVGAAQHRLHGVQRHLDKGNKKIQESPEQQVSLRLGQTANHFLMYWPAGGISEILYLLVQRCICWKNLSLPSLAGFTSKASFQTERQQVSAPRDSAVQAVRQQAVYSESALATPHRGHNMFINRRGNPGA